MSDYNFAYLDEQTKRMIRRALLKAVAIPGYQVPFASREMPMPYGWGTGGVQVTASCLMPDDVLKVIDQGADDTTNAVSIRKFFQKTADVAVTEQTGDATIIQTRHRIPEEDLTEDQILVYQVPIPEPLRFLEPRETETRRMHALEEYGLMHVKLYEDIARHGHIATAYAYPVKVEGRYVMDPSPIPKFDNPKMEMAALQLFGAGREQRIYAIPPYTQVVSLDFEDYPFERMKAPGPVRFAEPSTPIWMRLSSTTRVAGCSSVLTPTTVPSAVPLAISAAWRLRMRQARHDIRSDHESTAGDVIRMEGAPAMTSLSLRAPKAQDVDALTAMMNLPGVRAGTARLPYQPENGVLERYINTPPHVHTIVASWDGELVGYANLVRRFGRQSHCGDVFLFVHDEYWGRGIGTALIGEIADISDNWLGLVRLQLDVNVDNDRAVHLYERAGFEKEGQLRADMLREGELIDCYVMGRLRPAPRRVEMDG